MAIVGNLDREEKFSNQLVIAQTQAFDKMFTWMKIQSFTSLIRKKSL